MTLHEVTMAKLFPTQLLMFFLFACGGDSGNSDEFDRQEEVIPEPEVIQKVYRADLRVVNPAVVDDVEGQVIIRMEDETFEVNIAARNIPGAAHPQHIRTGRSCPTISSDINGDGYVDSNEAQAVSGGVFLPLDSDLDNVLADNLNYPNGGFLKAYAYREDTTRKQLVTELGPESGLDFGNRVVMILGVDASEELPPTVVSSDGRSPQETLPIACGRLTKIIGPE